jgi:DNA-directed RNA polymerase subunit beta'
MLASKNLLKPADGEPIISPSKDMVLGVFYLTILLKAAHKGDGRAFADLDEVDYAFQLGQVQVHSEIKVRAKTWYDDEGNRLSEPETRILDTTVGRVLFNRILPEDVQFVNHKLDKGDVKDLIADVYELCGQEITTRVADRIKTMGFEFAMRSGTTLAVADITIPPERKEIIQDALGQIEVVNRDFRRGLLTEQEKNEREINIWQATTDNVATAVRKHMDPDGNLAVMANSGDKRWLFHHFAVGRYAWFNGRSFRAYYPLPDPLELPRRLDCYGILHVYAWCSQRSGRHRASYRRCRISDSPPRGHCPGHHHQRA